MLRKIALAPKLLLASILVAAGIWLVLDSYQSRNIQEIINEQRNERLAERAAGNRLSFDHYLKSLRLAAKIITSRKQFVDYVTEQRSTNGWRLDNSVPLIHSRPPRWFPSTALIRPFPVRYVFLFAGGGPAREVYRDWPDPPPDILVEPNELLIKLSRNQVYLTTIKNQPWVITSDTVVTAAPHEKITLMLASALDDIFLVESLGDIHHGALVALVDSGKRLLASNRPDLFEPGATLDSLLDRYVVTGKSFFDYGASDLQIQFASFIPRKDYQALGSRILENERRQRIVTAAAFILMFLFIILLITIRIRNITARIEQLRRETLDISAGDDKAGDELFLLDQGFNNFADEIISSRQQLIEEKQTLEHTQQELEKAYQELKITQAQMLQQEKLASVGQLAAGVAHEINNPIGFVTSNLNSLRKYLDRLTGFINRQEELFGNCHDEELKAEYCRIRQSGKIDFLVEDLGELIAESLEGTERVRQIVMNLKNFSRMDEFTAGPADINECLDATINIAWNELKYKVRLHKDYGALPLTVCNAQQLNQAFLNLLLNAAQAIEEHGEITIRTRSEGNSILITVADTGVGIAVEDLPRVFEPFFTTSEVGSGTGLGLSITYDIINKHDGEIEVQSRKGEGTTFSIRLPVVTEASGA